MAASVVQGVLLQAPLLLPGAQASISQPSCCRAATDNAHFYGSMSVRLSLSPSSSVSSDVSCSGEDRVLLSIRTGSRCRSREVSSTLDITPFPFVLNSFRCLFFYGSSVQSGEASSELPRK
jgi:hypothetical protein